MKKYARFLLAIGVTAGGLSQGSGEAPVQTSQAQTADDEGVQIFIRQVIISVETFLAGNAYNKAYELAGRDTTAGAAAGACAFDVKMNDIPERPAAWAADDPYYNLANYGLPYPFPESVKTDASSLLTGQTPKAVSGSNNGCWIVYDGQGGYGVAAQSVTNKVMTIYRGRICSWKANEAGDGLLEELPADPNLWLQAAACGGPGLNP